VPLAVLSDGRAPWERAEDIEDVFVRPANEVGTMKGLIFNRHRGDFLYALEPFNLRLVRINVDTSARYCWLTRCSSTSLWGPPSCRPLPWERL
jgi:hypothetical protein